MKQSLQIAKVSLVSRIMYLHEAQEQKAVMLCCHWAEAEGIGKGGYRLIPLP